LGFSSKCGEVSGLYSSGVSVAFRHTYLHTTPAFDIPTVVEGALLEGEETLDAVVEVIAVVRMWKELGHVRQALVRSRIFQLQNDLVLSIHRLIKI